MLMTPYVSVSSYSLSPAFSSVRQMLRRPFTNLIKQSRKMNSANSHCRASLFYFNENDKQSFYCIFSQSWSLSFPVIQLAERIYWRLSIGIEPLPSYVEWSRRKTNYFILIFFPCRHSFLPRTFDSSFVSKQKKIVVCVHRTHTYSIHV